MEFCENSSAKSYTENVEWIEKRKIILKIYNPIHRQIHATHMVLNLINSMLLVAVCYGYSLAM